MKPPVHVLSALLTLVLDFVWFMLFESTPVIISTISSFFSGLFVGGIPVIPVIFGILLTSITLTSLFITVICFITVLLIQKFIDNDPWSISVTKGVVMGVIAGVPFPIIGTILAGPLLAWAGIYSLTKR